MGNVRKLDEIISDIEDVTASLEEAQAGDGDSDTLADARETLQRVTDNLDDVEEDVDSGADRKNEQGE